MTDRELKAQYDGQLTAIELYLKRFRQYRSEDSANVSSYLRRIAAIAQGEERVDGDPLVVIAEEANKAIGYLFGVRS